MYQGQAPELCVANQRASCRGYTAISKWYRPGHQAAQHLEAEAPCLGVNVAAGDDLDRVPGSPHQGTLRIGKVHEVVAALKGCSCLPVRRLHHLVLFRLEAM